MSLNQPGKTGERIRACLNSAADGLKPEGHLKVHKASLDILSRSAFSASGDSRSIDRTAAEIGSNEAKMSIRKSTDSRILALLPVVFLAGLAFAAPAMADEDCVWYGVKSAQQQQENEAKKCGLTGVVWNADVKVHEDWCATVSPDEWRKVVADRQAQLDKCGQ